MILQCPGGYGYIEVTDVNGNDVTTIKVGDELLITVYANEHYNFSEWWDGITSTTRRIKVNNSMCSSGITARFIPERHCITVGVTPAGGGTVNGSAAGQTCSRYTGSETLVLTAAESVNYEFVAWTDGETSPVRTVSFATDNTFVAQFRYNYVPPTWVVAANVEPAGSGTVTGTGTFTDGDSTTLEATAEECYEFLYWDNDPTLTDPRYVISPIINNESHTAYFRCLPPENLTARKITCNGAVLEWDQPKTCGNYTIIVSYNDVSIEYTFYEGQKGGNMFELTDIPEETDVEAKMVLHCNDDITSEAVYTRFTTTRCDRYYNVTTQASPSSAGTTTGDATHVLENTSVTITATAETGFHFVRWEINGLPASSSETYTFTLTGDSVCVAYFEEDAPEYNITVSANPVVGGTVYLNTSGTTSGTFVSGMSYDIYTRPDRCHNFEGWYLDGVNLGTNTHMSFNATRDGDYVAEFSCKAPERIGTTGEITCSSFAITWAAPSTCTGFEIELTSATATNNYTFVGAANNTYEFTGLAGGMIYTAKVRTSCGEDDVSDWASIDVELPECTYLFSCGVDPSAGGNAYIEYPAGTTNTSVYAPAGVTLTVVCVPNEHYTFNHWSFSTGAAMTNPYNYTTYAHGETFTAHLDEESQHTVNVISTDTNKGFVYIGSNPSTTSVTHYRSYWDANSITLHAEPYECYVFDHWTYDVGHGETGYITDQDYVLAAGMVAQDFTFRAYFKCAAPTIREIKAGCGTGDTRIVWEPACDDGTPTAMIRVINTSVNPNEELINTTTSNTYFVLGEQNPPLSIPQNSRFIAEVSTLCGNGEYSQPATQTFETVYCSRQVTTLVDNGIYTFTPGEAVIGTEYPNSTTSAAFNSNSNATVIAYGIPQINDPRPSGSGIAFDHWSVYNGSTTSTNSYNPYTFTVTSASQTCTAFFRDAKAYEVRAISSNTNAGETNINNSYPSVNRLVLDAGAGAYTANISTTVNSGFTFDKWIITAAGVATQTNTNQTFTLVPPYNTNGGYGITTATAYYNELPKTCDITVSTERELICPQTEEVITTYLDGDPSVNSKTYDRNDTLKLYADLSCECYEFKYWYPASNPSLHLYGNPETVIANTDETYYAYYEWKTECGDEPARISVETDKEVVCKPYINEDESAQTLDTTIGAEVKILAHDICDCWKFVYWYEESDPDNKINENPYIFTTTGNQTYHAVYEWNKDDPECGEGPISEK